MYNYLVEVTEVTQVWVKLGRRQNNAGCLKE